MIPKSGYRFADKITRHHKTNANNILHHMPRSSHPIETNVPPVAGDSLKAQSHPQPGQDSIDYAAWLREYRRWTQSGSCASGRLGEIEWGGEDCDLPKRKT